MKPKHTPGNWTVDYDGDGCHVTFDEGPVVYDTTEETEESRAEVAELRANAALISAAPELLQCLEDVLRIVYNEVGVTREHMRKLSATGFREVLAKAKGDSK